MTAVKTIIRICAGILLVCALSAGQAYAAKITVYGGSGRIGSKIVTEALMRGHTVTSVDIKAPDTSAPKRDHLTEIEGDILDTAALTKQIEGQDVVIVAINGPNVEFFVNAAKSITGAMRSLGAKSPRMIWLGGAGSLQVSPGGPMLMNTQGGIATGRPPVPVPGAPPGGMAAPAGPAGHAAALEYLRSVTDVPWSYLSPARQLEYDSPRTGKFRLGGDVLVSDDKGVSHISAADIAVAMVDEAEKPAHIRQRFTLGY